MNWERNTDFSEENIKMLNESQASGNIHPYTCDGSGEKCEKNTKGKEGKLTATKDGFICPCGNYKQEWW